MLAAVILLRPTEGQALRRVQARARAIRLLALDLAERELHSYQRVVEARRGQAEGDAGRVDEALSAASETPLEIARAAAELAQLVAGTRETGLGTLDGEAVASILLAEAACQAAARLVAINLAGSPVDPRRGEAAAAARRASLVREQVLSGGSQLPGG